MNELAAFDIRPLNEAEFERIRALAHKEFGLDLRAGKEQLVSARLSKHVRKLGYRTFRDYLAYVQSDATGAALTNMIDALTTNFTSFLREPAHFDFLRQTVLPEFRDRPGIDIWSAACSTGEEPYSIALSVLEELGDQALTSVRILATDISTRVLESAQQGVYQADRLTGLAPETVRRYFLRGERRWKGWFRVNAKVRQMIEFRRMNLTESFPSMPRFAVIFCRNVMIYFDRATQDRLVSQLTQCLEPGGYLFTGHSESLVHGSHSLEYVRPAMYRRGREGARTSTYSRSSRCAR
jgi:chemotaxis protein methyltransferase CheR